MSEEEDADPPRAREAVMMSPSRVTTVTPRCWPKMFWASRGFSATTVCDSKVERRSEICDERT